MHEASIAQNLLEIIADTAKSNNAEKVNKAFVTIGRLQAIEPDALMFAFDALKEDTISHSAQLIIDEIPITGLCHDCNHTSEYDSFIFTCNQCHSINVELISGEELKITEIEVD